MKAGALRHRVTLQQRSEPSLGTDTAGDPITTGEFGAGTWADVATVKAAIEEQLPRANQEGFSADALRAGVVYLIRLRYRADVLVDWRVKFGARIFNITSVINPRARGRETILVCEEGRNNG
jgi:SPP1 family predicted phage head-tail adaptor